MKKKSKICFYLAFAFLALLSAGSCKKDNSSQVTCGTGTITDIDGNVYNTVKIGTQCWMQQNLKTAHFNNGAAITEIEDSATWANITNTNATTTAWCYYDENAANNSTYGKLYNWYTVTDPRQLCPAGWHVPTDTEWHTLALTLDPDATGAGNESLSEGGELKSVTLWPSPNTGANNSSGFTALPSSFRDSSGAFGPVGGNACFWSSTPANNGNAWYRYLFFQYAGCNRANEADANANSVRCISN